MALLSSSLVEMKGISKQFPGVMALEEIDFNLKSGEVHALFGENGAGKSTLISILSGVCQPSSGVILMSGKKIEFKSVHDAINAGISTVFQAFSLVPTLSVFENIYLGKELERGLFIDRAEMLKETKKLFKDLDFDFDVRQQVSKLSRAEQQMVEIAKAIHFKAAVLILDEPTASLTGQETKKLFSFIKKAKNSGVGIIYISHRIQEFSQIADRITILRDGKLIGTVKTGEVSESELIEMMTGRKIEEIYPNISQQKNNEVILTLKDIKSAGVNGVTLEVKTGEILGIAGLVGAGKSRIWRSVIGVNQVKSGTIHLKGRDITNICTKELIKRGLYYLPPDRKTEGLQLTASSRKNLNVSVLNRSEAIVRTGLVSPSKQKKLVDNIAERVDLVSENLEKIVSKLSGGNQQKILFGKCFGDDQDIYIFDEPTVGVDISTRADLYQLIKKLVESGKAVVIISSDLPEVMNLSHRVLIFANGVISAELKANQINEENILKHFFNYKNKEHAL